MNKLLAASLCMIVVAACAAGAKQAAAPGVAPQTTGLGAGMQSPESARAELDTLYAKVEQERESMKLPEPQAGGSPNAISMSGQAHPTTQNDATCKPGRSEACQTSCQLSDSICTNTDRICKLAKDLDPDDDAAAKCTKATDTCKSAHEKCCACM